MRFFSLREYTGCVNFKQAALVVLQDASEPLHSGEITHRAIEQGLLETNGKTPDMTMAAQLYTDIKHRGKKSFFIQTGQNTFAINPAVLDLLPTHDEAEEEIVEQEVMEEREKIESSYIGTAGEHRVCSELLFRGFNASIMGVDEGIDIVAVKNNILIGIQVKTAHENDRGQFHYNIRKASFQKHKAHNVYYIFVLKTENEMQFLILPFHEVEKKTREQAIREIRKGTALRVTVQCREGKVFLGNRQHDMSYYLNCWDVIT